MKSWFEKVKAEFLKLFGKEQEWDKAASTAIAIAAPLVETVLGLVEPAVVPEVQVIVSRVQTYLAGASALVAEAQATPTLTGFLNAVESDMTSLLSLAGVKNSASASKISAIVTTIVGEVKAILSALPAA